MRILNSRMLLLLFLSPSALFGGMGHYYKTPFFPDIFMIDTHDWHTKIKFFMAYGSTTRGRNSQGENVPLLDIRGNQNWLDALQGAPAAPGITSLRTTADDLRAAAAAGDASPDFGKLQFNGKFTINESFVFARQNLKKGFFIKANIPIRDINLDNISFKDVSPLTGEFSQTNTSWVALKNNVDTILNAYDLCDYETPVQKTVLGDLMLLVGWQKVWTEIPGAIVDLFSVTLQGGLSVPTGSTMVPHEAFSFMGGHMKHWGATGGVNAMIGFTKHLRLGLFATGATFANKKVTQRMPTAEGQTGFIHLAAGKVLQKLGDQWGLTSYMVFLPPFIENLTFVGAYTYHERLKLTLCPENSALFDFSTINGPNLDRHIMHIIHLKLQYALKYYKLIVPNFAVFVDIPIRGKSLFNTTMAGAGIGLNINWSF